MDFIINTRDLDLDEQAEAYIQKKFAPIQRRLRGITDAKVEIRREPTRSAQNHVAVQVTLNVAGALLRAEERAPTLNAAIDVVARALDRQVMRYKGRRSASLKAKKGGRVASIRSADTSTEDAIALEEETIFLSGRVVRVKRFSMKPLTVDEAATQMELVGHDFFFFFNATTDQYNVLYRRRDGDYTVIEPEGF